MTLEQWIREQVKSANARGYRSATPGRKRHKPFDPNARRRPKKAKRAA